MAAVMHGKSETVTKVLRFQGVDVAAANEDGETALMLAVGEHEEVIAKQLLEQRAPVNAIDCQGRTALMRAVARRLRSRRGGAPSGRDTNWATPAAHLPVGARVLRLERSPTRAPV